MNGLFERLFRGTIKIAVDLRPFGIFIGLFYWGTTILGMYPYVPWTDDFYVKWFVWGMVDAVVLGVITALLHKPKAA